jgi:hypothetical protein
MDLSHVVHARLCKPANRLSGRMRAHSSAILGKDSRACACVRILAVYQLHAARALYHARIGGKEVARVSQPVSQSAV